MRTVLINLVGAAIFVLLAASCAPGTDGIVIASTSGEVEQTPLNLDDHANPR